MDPKIVCFIRDNPPLVYFANKINSLYPLTEVIVEKAPITRTEVLKRIKRNGVGGVMSQISDKIISNKRIKSEYDRFFGDMWRKLDDKISVYYTADINSRGVLEKIEKMRVDLIVDHGTSIVKDNIIENCELALNLHWGLSPYYRGTHCSEWALINWDPYNIGVTIHKLTKDIDGGSIFAQKRIDVESKDTLNSINMKLTLAGTELMLRGIEKYTHNEEVRFTAQDYSLGYLTYQRQWSGHLKKQVKYIEENGAIEKMLKHPSRNKMLPIVEIN
jgi:folate-dependent phosphoribosylglycinamide formyltransferase PurN